MNITTWLGAYLNIKVHICFSSLRTLHKQDIFLAVTNARGIAARLWALPALGQGEGMGANILLRCCSSCRVLSTSSSDQPFHCSSYINLYVEVKCFLIDSCCFLSVMWAWFMSESTSTCSPYTWILCLKKSNTCLWGSVLFYSPPFTLK